MMLVKLTLMIAIILAAARASAQGFAEDSTHHFGLSLLLGFGSIASYDNVGSPLPYSGITTPIGGEIEYVTPTVRHLLSGIGITSLGNAANLTNQFSNNASNYNNATYAFGDLRYRFTHYLTDISSSGIHVSMGGEWENIVFARAYNYASGFDYASGSGEFSSTLAAAADLSYEIGSDHLFRASVSLPLVAFVMRPAYGFINGNSSLFSYASEGIKLEEQVEPIGTMWSWRVGFDYDYAISGPFLLGLHFHELYYQYPMLAWRTIGAESDLVLDLTWRFDL